jgi:hypothetical protein
MAERKNYFVSLGSTDRQTNGARIAFRSPGDIYDPIKSHLGVSDVTENGAGFLIYGLAGAHLPRLSLKLGKKALVGAGLGNDAQSDGEKYIRVFCDPFALEKAFKELIGKTVRSRAISGVRIPKRRVYI